MAIIRRIWKGKSIISLYRRSSAPWLCPYAASSPSRLPELVCPELKKSVLGFFTQSKLFRCSSSSTIDLISHRSYVKESLYAVPIDGIIASIAASEQPIDGIIDVPLAQTGEGIAECELLKWFVQEGDHVEEFQPLCEVQSDKATIEITSRYKGQIAQILHAPSDIVKGDLRAVPGIASYKPPTPPPPPQQQVQSPDSNNKRMKHKPRSPATIGSTASSSATSPTPAITLSQSRPVVVVDSQEAGLPEP